MSDTLKLLKYIESSNKFLISEGAPKYINECKWVDVSTVYTLAGRCVLNESLKEKLKLLSPLNLPVTTQKVECPIEGRQVFMGLYYYDLDGWILNSVAIHYIVTHNIELPNGLAKRIKDMDSMK